MAELQSFVNPVPVVETQAPSYLGGSLSGLDRAVSDLSKLGQSAIAGANEAKRTSSFADAAIENEKIKSRRFLIEAVQKGQLTQEQANSFGEDEIDTLDALNQASAQGMNLSVRNALERRLLFQRKVAQDPSSAKGMAELLGIGKSDIGLETLTSETAIRKKQEQDDADYARKRMEEEGYTEHLGKTNEDVLEMWVDSTAAKREREIKQLERSALLQETSIRERAPTASKALMLQLASFNKGLNNIANAYQNASGTLLAGTDGTTLSLTEQENLYADEVIAKLTSTYADFPLQVEQVAKGIKNIVNQRDQARKSGIELGNAEYRALVERPMDYDAKVEDLIRSRFSNSQNPVTALRNSVEAVSDIFSAQTRIAKAADEAETSPMAPNLRKLMKDGTNYANLTSMLANLNDDGTVLLEALMNPKGANYQNNANSAVFILQNLSQEGMANSSPEFNKAISAIATAYEFNKDLSPAKNQILSKALLDLANDPKFVDMVDDSPVTRRLASPVADALSLSIGTTLRESFDEMASDIVSNLGNKRLKGIDQPFLSAFGRKIGQYLVADTASTNEAGVLQLKLQDGIDNVLFPDELESHKIVLDEYNRKLRTTQKGSEYKLLKNLSGARSTAEVVEQIIGSASGTALGSLRTDRAAPEVPQAEPTPQQQGSRGTR